jgi:2-polyprenyl-3-methyl-5-hydroxy-6-metoxy-1,4-benzoquinol methylase
MRYDEVIMESRPCPLGCAPDDEVVLMGHDRLYGLPGEFQVVRCRACSLIRTDPRPTPATMSFYYPDNYGPYESTRLNRAKATGGGRPSRIRIFGRSLKRLFKLNVDSLPRLRPGRLLEIGSASGAFMHRMAGAGWEVQGIEFSETAASSARALGYPVYAGALEDAPEPQSKYDLVVGWMVLEHLHDPVKALRKLHDWTNAGGWLVVSLPNAGSFELPVFKSAWFHLHLPHHLYHYNERTLCKVMEAGGWTIKKVFHQRLVSDLLASVGYALLDRGLFSWLAHRLVSFPEWEGNLYLVLYPFAYVLSILGQSGSMTVWATRRDD